MKPGGFGRPIFMYKILTCLLALGLCAPALAWKAAPGKPVEVCEAVIKPREELDVRLGPNGPEHVIPTPKCKLVDKGAMTYYADLTPSQQRIPAGTPCTRLMKRDHLTYGQFEGGGDRLWVLCTP